MSFMNTSSSLVINAIASTLTAICKENTKDSDENNPEAIKPFLCSQFPSVSIKAFIAFLAEEAKIEASTLVTMLILIDRLCAKNHFCLNYYNVHRIIIATLILSIKVIYDDCNELQFYSLIQGVSKREINYLEYECLTLLDFSLYISEEEYFRYAEHLSRVVRCVNKKRRGGCK